MLAVIFVFLRLKVACHGDISSFVQAGSNFSDRAKVPTSLQVFQGQGYDGQFYYRFALEPWNLSRVAHGITLDNPLRRQRIGYSGLAWFAAFGRAAWVPSALVIVNVIAVTATGFFAGEWVRALGRHAIWGLLPGGYFGLVWSLSRDLTEIVAVTFMLAGLVAMRRQRYLLAGLAFAVAVLCREALLAVVAAYFVVRAVDVARGRSRIGRADLGWLPAAVVFVTWEAVCRVAYGSVPLLAERGNTQAPFVALGRAVVRWLEHPRRDTVFELIQFVVVAAVIVAGMMHLRDTRASTFERVAFVFAVLLIVSLSSNVWNDDPMEFRTMTDAFVLGSGILLGTRGLRAAYFTGATWFVWLLAAGLRIKSL